MNVWTRKLRPHKKNNFAEAHFVVGKSESLFIGMRQANDGAFWKLEPFSKALQMFSFQRTRLGKGHAKELKKRMEVALT